MVIAEFGAMYATQSRVEVFAPCEAIVRVILAKRDSTAGGRGNAASLGAGSGAFESGPIPMGHADGWIDLPLSH